MPSMHVPLHVPNRSRYLSSEIFSCVVYYCLMAALSCKHGNQGSLPLSATSQTVSKFCLLSPTHVPSATAQFRPSLFCVWTPTVFKLVLLCLSLIPPVHSLLCHQWYLSKHLSVSNHPFASNVWWLPSSRGARSKFCDTSEKVLRHLVAACLFSFFSTTLPRAHLHTSTHTAHMHTHNTHTPEPWTCTYTHPSVF